jgi:hypothetical protein
MEICTNRPVRVSHHPPGLARLAERACRAASPEAQRPSDAVRGLLLGTSGTLLAESGRQGVSRMAKREDESNQPVAVTAGEVEQSRHQRRSDVDLARLDSEARKAMDAIAMMAANLRAFIQSRGLSKVWGINSDQE